MIGQLLPDQPKLDNPGMVQAVNVTPYAEGYRPVRKLLAQTTALTADCRGAAVLDDAVGTTWNYAGDATTVYYRAGADWTGLTGTYALQAEDRWEFTRWYDKVLAVNNVNRVQYGDHGQPLADAAIAAPIGKHIATARNFTMVGNLTANAAGDADAAGVSWSALGDPTNWTTAEAGYQHLDGAGEVSRILGGEYFTIFMTAGIFRGQAIGPPAHFQFDLVAPAKGAPYSGAIAQVGHMSYFLSYDGFYSFDGNNALPISSEKMARTFYDDLDAEYSHLMTSAVDLTANLVWFAYPGKAHSGVANRAYVYNYETGIWTGPVEQETQQLIYNLSPATLSDDMAGNTDDVGYAGIYTDDPQYLGGQNPYLGAFIPGNVFAVPTGKPLTALIETGEFAHNEGGYTLVNGFRPEVDGEAPQVRARIAHRNMTSGPVDAYPLQLINPRTGSVDQRISARYHSYQLEVSGDFTSIHGGQPLMTAGGRR